MTSNKPTKVVMTSNKPTKKVMTSNKPTKVVMTSNETNKEAMTSNEPRTTVLTSNDPTTELTTSLTPTKFVSPTSRFTTILVTRENADHVIKFSFYYPRDKCSRMLRANMTDSISAVIREQIADSASINASSMTNFVVTCASINVKFLLTSDNVTSVLDEIKKLKLLVETGNLTVSILGEYVSPIPSSFRVEKFVKTGRSHDGDDDVVLSAGVVIGIVLVGIAVVVLIAVVVIVILKLRYARRLKVMPVKRVASDEML